MKTQIETALPKIVSHAEWLAASKKLLEASLLDLFDWVSSVGNDFNRDFGVTTDKGETFGLSVFLRDGDRVFRAYFTTARGVEALGNHWSFLDLSPLGRQEDWEDSPEGWPQTPPYRWWRRHDEYGGNV